jgi:hypothetical protein
VQEWDIERLADRRAFYKLSEGEPQLLRAPVRHADVLNMKWVLRPISPTRGGVSELALSAPRPTRFSRGCTDRNRERSLRYFLNSPLS